jgi:dihydroorotate dehydrogenase electron transfer subunit
MGMKFFDITSNIVTNDFVSKDIFLLSVHAPEIAKKARPGQFCMLKVNHRLDPLLRRPLSIHDVKEDEVHFLYKVVGKGTVILSRMTERDEIDVLGPLGNPFSLKTDKALIVGGGMGIAPLLFLAKALGRENTEKIMLGARDKSELVRIREFSKISKDISLSTDNGTLGHKGFVTDILKEHLVRKGTGNGFTAYACGPFSMLRMVCEITKEFRIPTQVSLESHMGCGFGICLGCAVNRVGEGGYMHVCKDGPVFEANLIDWRVEQ